MLEIQFRAYPPIYWVLSLLLQVLQKNIFSVNEVDPGDPFQFTFLLKALEGYPNWPEDVSPDFIFQDVNPSNLDSFLCRGATLGFCLLPQPMHLD